MSTLKENKDIQLSYNISQVPTDHVKEAENCDHTVISHHYLDIKHKIRVDWQAPDSGCVEFRYVKPKHSSCDRLSSMFGVSQHYVLLLMFSFYAFFEDLTA